MRRLALGQLQEFLPERLEQVVHGVVIIADFDREVQIMPDQAFQALMDHRQRELGQRADVQERLFKIELLGQLAGDLGDVYGMVADPFQIGDDLQSTLDLAQIAGHRLL